MNRRTDRWSLKIFLPRFRILSEILTDFRILQLQRIEDSSILNWAWILVYACNQNIFARVSDSGRKWKGGFVYVIGLHAVQFGNNWIKKIPRTAKIGRGRRPSPIWLSEEFFERKYFQIGHFLGNIIFLRNIIHLNPSVCS